MHFRTPSSSRCSSFVAGDSERLGDGNGLVFGGSYMRHDWNYRKDDGSDFFIDSRQPLPPTPDYRVYGQYLKK